MVTNEEDLGKYFGPTEDKIKKQIAKGKKQKQKKDEGLTTTID